MAAFGEAVPVIFGALLDGLSEGLRRYGTVRLERLPRMADFCKWAVACEGCLLAPGHLHGHLRRCPGVCDGGCDRGLPHRPGAAPEAGGVPNFRWNCDGATGPSLTSTRRDEKSPRGWPANGSVMGKAAHEACTVASEAGIHRRPQENEAGKPLATGVTPTGVSISVSSHGGVSRSDRDCPACIPQRTEPGGTGHQNEGVTAVRAMSPGPLRLVPAAQDQLGRAPDGEVHMALPRSGPGQPVRDLPVRGGMGSAIGSVRAQAYRCGRERAQARCNPEDRETVGALAQRSHRSRR